MTPPTLTTRRLNRALLARQLLLERAPVTIEEALSRVGGLQTQYAPSGYVGLWTRVSGFCRDDLTRTLEPHRPRVFSSRNPFSVGTVLVDGRVVAAWSVRDGRVVTDPFEDLRSTVADEVEVERAALEAFHA